MENKRPGVMLYFNDLAPVLKYLDNDQLGGFMRQVIEYAQTGEEPDDLHPMAAMAFELMRPRLDNDATAYDNKVASALYASYRNACKRRGIDPVSRDEWDGTMPGDDTTDTDTDTDGHRNSPTRTPTDTDGHRQASVEVPNTTPTPTPTPNTTPTPTPNTERKKKERNVGLSVEENTGPYYALLTLPKWVTVDDDIKDEVTQIAKDIYTAYVPGKQVSPGVCISLYNQICEVESSGKVYVSNERVNILKGAYQRAKQMGKPGNWNVIKFILEKAGEGEAV